MDDHEIKRQSRLYERFDSVLSGLAMRFSYPAVQILRAEAQRVAAAYQSAGHQAAMLAPDEQVWSDYLTRVWVAVAPELAEQTEAWIGEPDKAVNRGDVAGAARRQLDTVRSKKTTGLVETSQNLIRSVIANADPANVAKEILAAYAKARPDRAHRISWAEAHEAGNYGSTQAVRGLRRVYDKVWIATPDDRVRDSHLDAHRQRVKLDDVFLVGGEPLMYPGDSSNASLENTINCRCVLSYQARARE